MDRRGFLAASGVGIAAGLAGCSAFSSEQSGTTTTESRSTTEGSGEEYEQAYPMIDFVELNSIYLNVLDYFRYIESGELKRLQPENGAWAVLSVSFTNLSQESRETPPRDNFQMDVAGQTYDAGYSLPVPADSLRPRPTVRYSDPPWGWTQGAEMIEPGGTEYLTAVFDVPRTESGQYPIVWEYHGETKRF